MIARLKELLFQNRGLRQTIIKNVFWLSMSQIGSRLIRAAIIIYAARILGAAEYGIFSYVLGFAGFFTLFADIGVNPFLTKSVAGHPEKKYEYFSASFWLKISLLLFTVLLVVFAAPHFTSIEKAKLLIPLVAFLVVFDGIRDFTIAYLRGMEKMQSEALITVIMNTTIAIAGFIILHFSATSKALLLSYIASVGTTAILSILILKNQFLKIFKYFNKKLIYETLNYCWPIAFSGMIGVFMLNTDIIMLGWWRSAEEIGYYSAGQRIIQVLYTLPAILAAGIFPALSRLIKQNEQQKEKALKEKSMVIVFFIAIPLVIGGIVLARPIFELIFGKEYLPGVPAFQILTTTLLLMSSGVILSNIVLAHNQQKKVVGYIAAGSFGNIIFNALLIPIWGIIGSAIATILAQLLNFGPTWRHLKKINDFHTLRHLKKIIASAIIMGIFSFVLNKTGTNVIVNIVVSAGIYFGTLYLLKESILNELKSIFSRLKKN